MINQTYMLPSENGLQMSTRICSATSQKRVVFIVTTVKTSDLTVTQMTAAFLRLLTLTKVSNRMYPEVRISSLSNNSFPTAHKPHSVSFNKSQSDNFMQENVLSTQVEQSERSLLLKHLVQIAT